MSHKTIRVLFLDADGTIRRSKSGKKFISGPDDIEIIPGVCETIKKFKDAGYDTCIVSNQGGIAHGFKTIDGVIEEFEKTLELMTVEGALIDGVIFCPFDEKGKVYPYNTRSLSRKPGYGMIADIVKDYWTEDVIVDLDNSLFVGDRPEDKGCADNAGIKFVHIDDFLSGNFDHNLYP